MKKLFFILMYISSACSLESLTPQSGTEKGSYLVTNNSGYDIKAQSFLNGKKLDMISIKNGETFKKSYSFEFNIRSYPKNDFGVFDYNGDKELRGRRDSVIISFGSLRYMQQYQNAFESNIGKKSLLFPGMDIYDTKKDESVAVIKKVVYKGPYQITFTKEDFDMAIPIKR